MATRVLHALCVLAPVFVIGDSAWAATIEVDALTTGPTACTLADAVASANTDAAVAGCERVGSGTADTIVFAAGLNGPIPLPDELIVAAGGLVIAGPDRERTARLELVAASQRRHFDLAAGAALTLTDLALTDGYAAELGGALRAVTGNNTLVLERCTLADNTAFAPLGVPNWGAAGGAIVIGGGRLELRDSELVDNLATGNFAGALGGAIVAGSTTVVIERTTFDGNTAASTFYSPPSIAFGYGGALYLDGGEATITSSTFYDNVASQAFDLVVSHARGGGIWASNDAQVAIRGCTFVANRTVSDAHITGRGDQFYLGTGALDVRSSLFVSGEGFPFWSSEGGTISAANNGCNSSACYGGEPNSISGTFGAPADLGGWTRTIAPPRDSGALSALPLADCEANDQRGVARAGERCDLGAHEVPLVSFYVSLDAPEALYVPPPDGDPLTLGLAVKLVGEPSASATSVTCTVPGAPFVSGTGAFASGCSASGDDVTCALGVLGPPTLELAGSLLFDADTLSGASLDVTCAVSSTPPDSDASDDRESATITLESCGDGVVTGPEVCDPALTPGRCAPGCVGRYVTIDTVGAPGPEVCAWRDALSTADTGQESGGCTLADGAPTPLNVVRFDPALAGARFDPGFMGVQSSIVIQGPPGRVTIDRQGGSGTLAANGSLFLSDIDFENASDVGGSALTATADVSSPPRTIVLERCRFVGHDNDFDAAVLIGYAEVEIRDVEFADNRGREGGALKLAGCDATIERTTFSGNHAETTLGLGGAILADVATTLTIVNSTFSDNRAFAAKGGGAVYLDRGSSADIRASTFIDNRTAAGGLQFGASGASLVADDSTLALTTSVFRHLTPGVGLPDGFDPPECALVGSGAFAGGSGSYLAFDSDAQRASCGGDLATARVGALDLADLGDNGGLTPTAMPARTSVVLSGAPQSACEATDQRGVARSGARCDLGAVERDRSFALALTAPAAVYLPPAGEVPFDVGVTVTRVADPASATVTVTCDLGDAALVSAAGALAACAPSGAELVCPLGTLAGPTLTFAGTLTLGAPAATAGPGALDVACVVSSEPLDDDGSDDRATVTIARRSCGDGEVTDGEVCDDGGLGIGGSCDPTCSVASSDYIEVDTAGAGSPSTCSLADALTVANTNLLTLNGCERVPGPAVGSDMITFSPDLATVTLTATLTVSDDVILDGPPWKTTLTGNDGFGLFTVAADVTLTLSDLVLSEGHAALGGGAVDASANGAHVVAERVDFLSNEAGPIAGNGTGRGGALALGPSGGAITDCLFRENRAESPNVSAFGGAIYTTGPLVVRRSTFDRNVVVADNTGAGGAIAARDGGTLDVENATFYDNRANAIGLGTGGAIYNESASTDTLTTVAYATFAGNRTTSAVAAGGQIATTAKAALTASIVVAGLVNATASDCALAAGSAVSRLVVDRAAAVTQCQASDTIVSSTTTFPNPPTDRGGPTPTLEIAFQGAAFDALPSDGSVACPAVDQRGFLRPMGVSCDIGAFEYYPPAEPDDDPSFTIDMAVDDTERYVPAAGAEYDVELWVYPVDEASAATSLVVTCEAPGASFVAGSGDFASGCATVAGDVVCQLGEFSAPRLELAGTVTIGVSGVTSTPLAITCSVTAAMPTTPVVQDEATALVPVRFCGDGVVSAPEVCDPALSPGLCAPGCIGRYVTIDTVGPPGPAVCAWRDALSTADTGQESGGCTLADGAPTPLNVVRFDPALAGARFDPGFMGVHGSIAIQGPPGRVTIDRQGGGGTLAANGSLFLSDIDFENASDVGGSALTAIADVSSPPRTIVLERCRFVGHDNDFDAAVWIGYAEVEIRDVEFADNRGREGGALKLVGCDATIERTTFSGNHAETTLGLGGAILADVATTLTIVNSTFADNRAFAAKGGGAVYLDRGSSADIRASTFIDNLTAAGGLELGAAGASLVADDSTLALTTSVFRHLSPGTGLPDGFDPPECALVGTGSLAIGSGSYLAFDADAQRAACGGDPATARVGALDLSDLGDHGGLTPTAAPGRSSVVLSGAPLSACEATDQRGVARTGERCDIGAFEAPLDSFALALDADAEVYVPPGDGAATFDVEVAVSLVGAVAATSVAVTCDLDGATFVGASGALSGACGPGGDGIVCDLGALAGPTTLVTGTLTLDARAATATSIDLGCSLSSTPADAFGGDDTATTSTARRRCGDGAVTDGEACDDAGAIGGGCNATCSAEVSDTIEVDSAGASTPTTCNLADAITVANTDVASLNGCERVEGPPVGSDVITFAPSLTAVALASGLTVSDDLVVDGPPAKVTLGGDETFTLFTVTSDTALTLRDLVLTGGRAPLQGGAVNASEAGAHLVAERVDFVGNAAGPIASNGAAYGAAIAVGSGGAVVRDASFIDNLTESPDASARGGAIRAIGPLVVERSTFSGNRCLADNIAGGGAIGANGALTIVSSTFYDNRAQSASGALGGAVLNESTTAGATSIDASTFANNTTASSGAAGGQIATTATLTLRRSILVGGKANTSASDCAIPANSAVDKLLVDRSAALTQCLATASIVSATTAFGDPPADNGGPTPTLALAPGDAAVDALAIDDCLATDQRGIARPQGAACDLGAFELGVAGFALAASAPASLYVPSTAAAPFDLTLDLARTGTTPSALALEITCALPAGVTFLGARDLGTCVGGNDEVVCDLGTVAGPVSALTGALELAIAAGQRAPKTIDCTLATVPADDDGDNDATVVIGVRYCGDLLRDDPERCDDGATAGGCKATCDDCDPGFFGASCSACPSASGQICNGRGACVGSGDIDATAGGFCVCDAGYSGPTCTGFCGDGNVEGSEACDGRGESATCNADCSAVTCSDGILNTLAGEECDPGGASTAGCPGCRLAAGYTCDVAGTACRETCGTFFDFRKTHGDFRASASTPSATWSHGATSTVFAGPGWETARGASVPASSETSLVRRVAIAGSDTAGATRVQVDYALTGRGDCLELHLAEALPSTTPLARDCDGDGAARTFDVAAPVGATDQTSWLVLRFVASAATEARAGAFVSAIRIYADADPAHDASFTPDFATLACGDRCVDADGDGWGTGLTRLPHACAGGLGDCAPEDPTTHPGAAERCFDRVDDDCDGLSDPWLDPSCAEDCGNLVDDGADGLVDCADPACDRTLVDASLDKDAMCASPCARTWAFDAGSPSFARVRSPKAALFHHTPGRWTTRLAGTAERQIDRLGLALPFGPEVGPAPTLAIDFAMAPGTGASDFFGLCLGRVTAASPLGELEGCSADTARCTSGTLPCVVALAEVATETTAEVSLAPWLAPDRDTLAIGFVYDTVSGAVPADASGLVLDEVRLVSDVDGDDDFEPCDACWDTDGDGFGAAGSPEPARCPGNDGRPEPVVDCDDADPARALPADCAPPARETDCDDGRDDDGDGATDCDDSDCAETPACAIDPDDRDGDGVPDALEDLCGSDPDDATSTPSDGDDDDLCDALDDDDDGDDWSDADERACGSDPALGSSTPLDCDGDRVCDAEERGDVDGDGTPDGSELACGVAACTPDRAPSADDLADPDGDEAANCADDDDDGDDWSDDDERLCGSDPRDAASRPIDLDGDERCDEAERDGDGDGVPDASEVRCGTDPTDPDDTPSASDLADPDGDSDPSCVDEDDDGDDLDDLDEVRDGTDPRDGDSDDDGLADGDEGARGTDPGVADSDGDGLQDGTEAGVVAGTRDTGPAFVPDAHPATMTDPTRADSDGDGVADGDEDADGDGDVDPGEGDPNDADDGLGDRDDDGLSDRDELFVHGTDPGVADSDGDGVSDGDEVDNGTDPTSPDAEPEPESGPEADPGAENGAEPIAEDVSESDGDPAEADGSVSASGDGCQGGGSLTPIALVFLAGLAARSGRRARRQRRT